MAIGAPPRWAARLALPAALMLCVLAPGGPAAATATARYTVGQVVDYPLVFPLGTGDAYYADDDSIGFGACRDGCTRIHEGIDLLAPQMTEVYAVADGTVAWTGTNCCSVALTHDDGWGTWYIHLNNDTPGTDDGLGWGIAPGIEPGARVEAGQLIGWVGDSGNAEDTVHHLHFELHSPEGVEVDPFHSMEEAESARGFTCEGEPATRVDTNGDHSVVGTSFADVIVGTAGDDYLDGASGDDLVCGGDGADSLHGGPGNDDLDGGTGRDLLFGDAGNDRLLGGGGADIFYWDPGRDTLIGGRGRDTATYHQAPEAIQADLIAGTVTGDALDVLASIEILTATAFDDTIAGDGGDNTLRGLRGNDRLEGGAGDDLLGGGGGADVLDGGAGNDQIIGGGGGDEAYGGPGEDSCRARFAADCET